MNSCLPFAHTTKSIPLSPCIVIAETRSAVSFLAKTIFLTYFFSMFFMCVGQRGDIWKIREKSVFNLTMREFTIKKLYQS